MLSVLVLKRNSELVKITINRSHVENLFVHDGAFLFISLFFSRKEQIAEQREYKKKKAQKKVQRMKELEQEREEQKSKWQQFNNKAYSKNKKGQVSCFLRLVLQYQDLVAPLLLCNAQII